VSSSAPEALLEALMASVDGLLREAVGLGELATKAGQKPARVADVMQEHDTARRAALAEVDVLAAADHTTIRAERANLYPDLEELHGTGYMDALIEETGAVLMGRRTLAEPNTTWSRRSDSSRSVTGLRSMSGEARDGTGLLPPDSPMQPVPVAVRGVAACCA
jgi:hypothetical protein